MNNADLPADEPENYGPATLVRWIGGNRFVRFLTAGVLNTAIGYAIYAVFVLIGLLPELAVLLATTLGVLVSFRITGPFVFGSRDNRLLLRYVAVYGAIYVVNAGLLRLLIVMELSPLLAQALLLPLSVVATFVAMRRLVFGARG